LQLGQAAVEAIAKGVTHGDQLDRAGGVQRLAGGAVPRPPQPIRPILIVSSPAACALRPMASPPANAPPTTAAVEVFMKSRREAPSGCLVHSWGEFSCRRAEIDRLVRRP